MSVPPPWANRCPPSPDNLFRLLKPSHANPVNRCYPDLLRSLLRAFDGDPSDSFLFLCAGREDLAAACAAGLTQVTISNLGAGSDQLPDGYEWRGIDAEAILAGDGSYDFVVEHWGLHHCRFPWTAVAEMLRVSRKGVLFVEPVDSLFTSLGRKFGVGQNYELKAVKAHGYEEGGMRNTGVPNYVYRFTRKELEKNLRTMFPEIVPEVRVETFLHIPASAFGSPERRGFLRRGAETLLSAGARGCPLLHNQIAGFVRSPSGCALQPWLRLADGRVHPDPAKF